MTRWKRKLGKWKVTGISETERKSQKNLYIYIYIGNIYIYFQTCILAGAGRYRVIFGTDEYMSSCRARHPGVWPPETFYPTAAVVFNCAADQVGEPDDTIKLHPVTVLIIGHCAVIDYWAFCSESGQLKHCLRWQSTFPFAVNLACASSNAILYAETVSNTRLQWCAVMIDLWAGACDRKECRHATDSNCLSPLLIARLPFPFRPKCGISAGA